MSDFDLESLIVNIPDYPEPGVIFKDITPLMADPTGLSVSIDRIADHFMSQHITKVVGAEAWVRASSPPASRASSRARFSRRPTRSSTVPTSSRSTRTPSRRMTAS